MNKLGDEYDLQLRTQGMNEEEIRKIEIKVNSFDYYQKWKKRDGKRMERWGRKFAYTHKRKIRNKPPDKRPIYTKEQKEKAVNLAKLGIS